jgi:hypothetical protein
MSNLVKVKRVAFGSPEFMFLRNNINALVKERLGLKNNYELNAVKYNWISNTMRALGDLVYFVYQPRVKPVVVVHEVGVPRPATKKADKKTKIKKPQHPSLF